MLLLHQTGSVKIGEILHLKIKNTSAIALRAAFVHGPYTLYAAAYPSNFNPNTKFENPRRDGVPEFEPNLKAGGSFSAQLSVPEDVRETAGTSNRDRNEGIDVKSVTWIIEVSSQVIFSNSAAVHYEILLGRDAKSLSMGFGTSITGGGTAPMPGQVSDHQQSQGAKDGHHNAQPKGIFSRAIKLKVDDTASLWNTPRMPEWEDSGQERPIAKSKDAPIVRAQRGKEPHDAVEDAGHHRQRRQKKVHLVVLTHGLHGNLGSDMLYLKESIDITAKQAKADARERRAKRQNDEQSQASSAGQSHEEDHEGKRRGGDGNVKHPTDQREANTDVDDDEEEIIVRGFSGNAVRTERGIKYLGKRLAKYVLAMTYPDQPYRPVTKKSTVDALSHALKPESQPEKSTQEAAETPVHSHSNIIKAPYHDRKLAYKITSISFIAHSLGGLTQTYAVAYIQKHSPQFFDIIKPINFIALASPFLGLSNENPLYVRFALDFGLVGRTGQDLGLTWRAPTIARSGWGAIVNSIGESAHKKIDGEVAPEAKPLLRILPTGPAHTVLKKFRNRTVYSNVVNDGIVPLRTSCLLFLDWQGLGRVEKARRENGLVGTMAGWGWAELTGANSSSPGKRSAPWSDGIGSDTEDGGGDNTPTRQGYGGEVPQPPADATDGDDTQSRQGDPDGLESEMSSIDVGGRARSSSVTKDNSTGPLSSLIGLFRPNPSPKQHNDHPKHTKIYQTSQTIKVGSDSSVPTFSTRDASPKGRSKATTGDSDQEDVTRLSAPPKTTFFEAAGDLLKPPLPSVEFFIDPSNRPRTIFHDRVYHPEDIPPPPLKKRSTFPLLRRMSSSTSSTRSATGVNHTDSGLSARDYDDTKHTNPDKDPRDVVDGSAMKVEEKIARAYHRDLSWRKVLVRLEPDAHNNMIVRRMFANAYGWPVIKHLVETHFSDAAVANTRDEDEGNQERAKSSNEAPDSTGKETKDDENRPKRMLKHSDRTDSERLEATDTVPALNPTPKPSTLGKALASAASGRRPSYDRVDSSTWSDRDWADSADDSDDDTDGESKRPGKRELGPGQAKKAGWNWTEAIVGKGPSSPKGTDKKVIDGFLGKGDDGTAGSDARLASDATEAKASSVDSRRMSLGLGALGHSDDEGVSEQVARLTHGQTEDR